MFIFGLVLMSSVAVALVGAGLSRRGAPRNG
jgi:hypothetical protein